MIVASCLAGPNRYSIVIVATALPLVAIRILVEEKILMRGSPAYVAYADQVSWRLVPGLW
jgi:protein-S-isoprenylcysteine O-methyltransferase Ste14